MKKKTFKEVAKAQRRNSREDLVQSAPNLIANSKINNSVRAMIKPTFNI